MAGKALLGEWQVSTNHSGEEIFMHALAVLPSSLVSLPRLIPFPSSLRSPKSLTPFDPLLSLSPSPNPAPPPPLQSSEQGDREFVREVELLSRVHHRHLVSLMGFCAEQGERMLVYEYMGLGSLFDHLHGRLIGRVMRAPCHGAVGLPCRLSLARLTETMLWAP